MRACGSPAAGLLLLILCLGTRSITNAENIRTRRSAVLNPRQTQFLDTNNPRRINNGILSLIENQNVVPRNKNAQTTDQRVDQTEIVLLNTDDMDLENIQHALSIVGYEPQKINKKGKRKTVDKFNNNPDPAVSSSENVNLATAGVTNVYYEVPRVEQPKRIIVTPQYHSKPIQVTPKPQKTEPKPRSRNIEYIYPVSTSRPIKPRFSRTRPPLNLQTTLPTDEPKLENVPTQRIPATHRPYSTPPTESRKQKYYTDFVTSTTPPSDSSHSTKPSRRKKSRKRVANKPSKRQEPLNSPEDGNNYPAEFLKAQGSASEGSRIGSRRAGLLSKYDGVPRPFSVVGSTEGNQEGNLEKLVGSTVSPGSNNRNSLPNAAKNNDGGSSGYSKVVDPVRNSLLNGRLYGRKGSRGSSDPVPKDRRKEAFRPESVKSGSEPSFPYETRQTSERNDSSEDKRQSSESIQGSNKYRSGPDLGGSETPGSSVHQKMRTPAVTVHTVGPVESTVPPYSAASLQPINYVYYPTVLSTLAPVQRFEARQEPSTVSPWTGDPKLSESRTSNEDVSQKKNYREASDGVAEATSVGSDESEGSKDSEKYETREEPSEDRQTEDHDLQSHEYIQDDQHAPESGGDGYKDDYKQEDKGYERYAQKYDDGKEEDALTDGSNDNESHQSAKEGAAGGDAVGKGGQGKFEKGGGTTRSQEHHEDEGEKGDKGYKSWHEHEKHNKGEHDKERHSNYYNEEDGKEKEQKEEGGYHEERNKGEMGEKQSEFDEKGKHQKGYNTKGQHYVHKKDEFEKRTEFFDEFHEDGDTENDGEFYHEHEMSKGGNYKSGHHDEGDHKELYGKEAKHEKGSHYHDDKGHKVSEGKDHRYENENMHGEKKNHHHGKKWGYKEGDDGNKGEKEH